LKKLRACLSEFERTTPAVCPAERNIMIGHDIPAREAMQGKIGKDSNWGEEGRGKEESGAK